MKQNSWFRPFVASLVVISLLILNNQYLAKRISDNERKITGLYEYGNDIASLYTKYETLDDDMVNVQQILREHTLKINSVTQKVKTAHYELLTPEEQGEALWNKCVTYFEWAVNNPNDFVDVLDRAMNSLYRTVVPHAKEPTELEILRNRVDNLTASVVELMDDMPAHVVNGHRELNDYTAELELQIDEVHFQNIIEIDKLETRLMSALAKHTNNHPLNNPTNNHPLNNPIVMEVSPMFDSATSMMLSHVGVIGVDTTGWFSYASPVKSDEDIASRIGVIEEWTVDGGVQDSINSVHLSLHNFQINAINAIIEQLKYHVH